MELLDSLCTLNYASNHLGVCNILEQHFRISYALLDPVLEQRASVFIFLLFICTVFIEVRHLLFLKRLCLSLDRNVRLDRLGGLVKQL